MTRADLIKENAYVRPTEQRKKIGCCVLCRRVTVSGGPTHHVPSLSTLSSLLMSLSILFLSTQGPASSLRESRRYSEANHGPPLARSPASPPARTPLLPCLEAARGSAPAHRWREVRGFRTRPLLQAGAATVACRAASHSPTDPHRHELPPTATWKTACLPSQPHQLQASEACCKLGSKEPRPLTRCKFAKGFHPGEILVLNLLK
jgi:hypothetical protein